MTRLLLPVDGSPRTQRAVDYVVKGSGRERAEVHLLNVQPPILARELWHFLESDPIIESRQATGEEVMRPAREALVASGIGYVTSVSIGRTAEAILRYAKENHCDAIVMGTSARSTLCKLVAGSVSLDVAGHADVPVTLLT